MRYAIFHTCRAQRSQHSPAFPHFSQGTTHAHMHRWMQAERRALHRVGGEMECKKCCASALVKCAIYHNID